MAATGVGSTLGMLAVGIAEGMPACEGASRPVFTDAGGTVSAVSALLEVQPDRAMQAMTMADVAAERRMRTRTQYTVRWPNLISGPIAGFH